MNFVKAPPPRPLNQQESLDSLNHWKTLFRNYYRRDSSYKQFLHKDCTWNFSEENYGLQTLAEETPDERAENLSDFLSTLAGFLPHSYLTQKLLEDTTCLQDCWNLIYEHYNVKITPETLLDFEGLNKDHSENYRQYYDRLLQHIRLHLAPRGAIVEKLENTRADSMTISLMNLVALQWLRKCHPRLIGIVRKEYSTELRRGDQLASLVPIIASNIDSLIARYVGNDNVSYVTHELAQPKVNQTYFSNKRKPPFQTKKRPINTQDDLFCPGCFATGKSSLPLQNK